MDTIKLTSELLHSAGSYGGNGFNRTQLQLLGVKWPPVQGWLRSLVGKEISVETWTQILSLKGIRGLRKQRLLLRSNHSFFDLGSASCAYRITLSPHEWIWTQAEQEAMAEAIVRMDAEIRELKNHHA